MSEVVPNSELRPGTVIISDTGMQIRLMRKIGNGAFGDVYLGRDITSDKEFAVKVEHLDTKHPQLIHESRVYQKCGLGDGFPTMVDFGQLENHHYLVMELLGPSLEDLFTQCGRKFSLPTVLLLAPQMIARVMRVHRRGMVHRDLKPDNFLIGRPGSDNEAKVFLIDFGLAKKYRNGRHTHIMFKKNKSLTGTARYASLNTHAGAEQSRRDDMEVLGYVFMYFLRGGLPWQNLSAIDVTKKYERIHEKKSQTPVEVLCEGFPEEFAIYFNYCRSLRFDDTPNYFYCQQLFTDLAQRMNIFNSYIEDLIDWLKPKKTEVVLEKKTAWTPCPFGDKLFGVPIDPV